MFEKNKWNTMGKLQPGYDYSKVREGNGILEKGDGSNPHVVGHHPGMTGLTDTEIYTLHSGDFYVWMPHISAANNLYTI